ncbi:MAG: tRNA (N(6)-L-threonylcarbamoyladenosine(37)-C(2))-methylthiotransferase MtaB [Treponema bryantii]|nr:tRNA (N(6)-L-threonylcarbamoyladenosine(37)-C(2))-methylthiotransferase MtaB [Treponema bryantii]
MQNFNNYIVRIETLGCRLNQIESESIAKVFSENNFSINMNSVSASETENDNVLLVIVNTCTVTQKSEQKARRIIRLLLKKCPNALIVVTGCYAQLNSAEINNIDNRIICVGGQIKSRIKQIPELLCQNIQNNWNVENLKNTILNSILTVPQEKKDFPEKSFELSTTSFIAHSRASLKIQDGCNNNCSYCAIHMARGHSVSLDVEEAIKRVVELESKGVEEVVLTTVNIAQYKSTYNGQIVNFSKLLKLLLASTKKISFRISSLYPEIVDDDFCEAIKSDRVCPHFHISVQSGSDKILKLMNRTYKKEDVVNACNKLKSVKENPFLACDIITGFPGETEDDFLETMDLCNQCGFCWIHAFPFSERKGTVAVTLKNKVPQEISKIRCNKLNEWAMNQKINYINANVGKERFAILEVLRKPQYVYHCVTDNFLHCQVQFPKEKEELPQGTKVKISIDSPLIENVKKGGEVEANAHIIF